ncbi:MAG: AmmeMemoRadiSam system protein B [Candidatus Omnitrophica bacterium]|nr:AmmeMemoRadiSam system protein B [Candidatus Omnitrophota bacterium]
MKTYIRKPAVAGQFYHSSPERLKKEIGGFIDPGARKTDAKGCVMPHAGYMYSGKVAAEVVSSLTVRDKIILLGPNHTGYGCMLSMMSSGRWETPLGEVPIDESLAKSLLSFVPSLEEDVLAHQYEHSLEVELPLFQYFRKDFTIVPIAVMTEDVEILKRTGDEIAGCVGDLRLTDSVLIVASSDMTHYESQKQASHKDKEAIEAILNLDEDALIQKVRGLGITMCGFAPVVIMLRAVKKLGARSATLIKYQTSGDVTGDMSSVVGYAGIVIE